MQSESEHHEKRKQLISKHLEGWDGLVKESINSYADTGKVSGGLLLSICRLMEEHKNQALQELVEEIRLPIVNRDTLEKRLLEDPKAESK